MKNHNSIKRYKVYKHVFPNGKVYVGITSQAFKDRWKAGEGYGNNPYITHAIHKYGWENIKHFALPGNFTLEEANAREKQLIEKYHSNNPKFGYNLTSGGDGCPGVSRPLTEETKAKISKANKGKKRSEACKKHLSEVMTGRKLDPEVVERIAAGHKGLKHTKSWKDQMKKRSQSYNRDAFGHFIGGDPYGNQQRSQSSL